MKKKNGFFRYYLKTNGISETLVPDEMAPELIREAQVHFLQLNAVEVAIQLTLQDFSIFRQIESTEYVDDLFGLNSRYGTPMLSQFAEVSELIYVAFLRTGCWVLKIQNAKINFFYNFISNKNISGCPLLGTSLYSFFKLIFWWF